MSLGSLNPCSDFERDVYSAVVASGVTVVVSAGNDGNDQPTGSPANCPGVIAVGAAGPDVRARLLLELRGQHRQRHRPRRRRLRELRPDGVRPLRRWLNEQRLLRARRHLDGRAARQRRRLADAGGQPAPFAGAGEGHSRRAARSPVTAAATTSHTSTRRPRFSSQRARPARSAATNRRRAKPAAAVAVTMCAARTPS